MKYLLIGMLLLATPTGASAQLIHNGCGKMEGYEQKERTVRCAETSEYATSGDGDRTHQVILCNGVPREKVTADKGWKISVIIEGIGVAKICFFKEK